MFLFFLFHTIDIVFPIFNGYVLYILYKKLSPQILMIDSIQHLSDARDISIDSMGFSIQ